MPHRLARLAAALVLPLLLGGCLYTRAQTDSPRTATEQLLLTQSAWRAVGELDLAPLAGHDVRLVIHSLAGDDAAYLEAVLSERLRVAGARIAADGEAGRTLVVFAETYGTVSRGFAFGIPPLPLGGYVTPGLPFFQIKKQRGYAGLRTLVRDEAQHVLATTEPVLRSATFEVTSFLVFAIRRNDIYPGEDFDFGLD